MIFFVSTLRTRRPRKATSVTSLVRALGTVQISEQPPLAGRVQPSAEPSHSSAGQQDGAHPHGLRIVR